MDFEKLGAFYLGRRFDWQSRQLTNETILYDAKDLTTHAVCVGMTGSGKTGLCLTLLEEAAIDGVPAIVIDPKGDIGNLLLTFPQLQATDFRPWIDEGSALRQGQTPEQFAAAQAELWRNGLAQWGQDGARIARLRNAVDLAIYTPGGDAGLPVTVLKSFDAPPPKLVEQSDAFRDRVAGSAAGLLALLGLDADPVRSREHILISNILDRAWRRGKSLNLPLLIREIQAPPFDSVGVMDLESFFPSAERLQLAMTLNNLLASPTFAAWMEGEPLSAQRLLFTPTGKPRISILSIAHLSDSERMFFVTILLNEVLTWMRGQPGASTLRALLYMDEVFGYFPPTANPPSKTPMLTLLKQARAFGLGVVLATQNPVDLDYKGLANTGTWFLGRMQTQRDKDRVLDGLEGASMQSGSGFDRATVEKILSSLGKRVFLMSNAHEDAPVVFQTRWAMSYLRGPLARGQIRTLMAGRKAEQPVTPVPGPPAAAAFSAAASLPAAGSSAAAEPAGPPRLPASIRQRFALPLRRTPTGGRLVYRPALLGECRLHFVRASYKVDLWRDVSLLTPIRDDALARFWEEAEPLREPLDLDLQPEEPASFAELPPTFSKAKNYTQLGKDLKACLYRTREVSVWKCRELKQYSEADEAEDEFRARLAHQLREKRELRVEKLRKRYASKLATQKDRIDRAEVGVSKEQQQFRQKSMDTALSFGQSILSALFGRKLASSSNVSRAATSMRRMRRAADERTDIQRAKEKLEAAEQKLADLEAEFEEEVAQIEDALQVENLELERLTIRPRKSDLQVTGVQLVWTPWIVDAQGIAEPAYQ